VEGDADSGSIDADTQTGAFTQIVANATAVASAMSTAEAAASASGTIGSTNGVLAFDGWTFDVVDENVAYHIVASGSHSGMPSNSSPGSISFSFENLASGVLHDFHLTNSSNSLDDSGELAPGRYQINITAAAGASESCLDPASASATASGTFTLTLSPVVK